MKKERFTICVLAIGLAFCAGAQSLDKEIKVQRDIIPEHRSAERLPISPVISLPAVNRSKLNYSMVDKPMGITPAMQILPVNYPDVNYPEIYPGYAAIGYMPVYNAGVSAGYRLINTSKTRLGGWVQYNGRSYKPNRDTYIKRTVDTDNFSEHAVSVGVNLNQRTSAVSSLSADVDYSYYHYCMPSLVNASQGVNNFNGSVAWRRDKEDGYLYGVSGGFSRFAFLNPNRGVDVNNITYLFRRPIRQNEMNFSADGGFAINDYSKGVIGIEFNYLHTPMTEKEYVNTKFDTWMLRLTPGYRYRSDYLSADVGLKVDVTSKAGAAVHVAPDIKVVYKPFSLLDVRFEAGGGEVQNTASSLFADMPYMSQLFAFKNSHVPVTLDAGVTLGVIKGFYLDVFGGWAKANNWLLPVAGAEDGIGGVNVSAWHVGAEIGYHHGDMLDIKLKAETVSGSGDVKKSYYLWRDRAKYVIDGKVVYTPIKPLDFSLGYILRGKRKSGNTSLGSVNSLNFGAKYDINEKLAVFINGENLLNKHYFYIGDVPSQGITGLAGVTLKF